MKAPIPGIAPGVISSPPWQGSPDPSDYYREIYARGLAGEKPELPISWAELERRAMRGDGAPGGRLRVRGRRRRGHDAREPRGLSPLADRAPDASRRRRARPRRRPSSAPRCRRRCCWRRSACRRSSIRRASWRRPEPRHASGSRWSSARRPPTPWRRSPRRRDAARAGTSSTGRTTPRSPRAWSGAPRPPGTRRSWSPSTRSSRAGSRATSSRRGCRSWRGSGTPTSSRIPCSARQLDRPPEEDLGAATGHYLSIYVNPSLSWDEIGRLREWTSLPILVKGVLHPDDARRARERGVDGLVVSNHGGRQVDGAIASLDALPAIADAVGDDLVGAARQRRPRRRRRAQGAGARRRRGAARPALPVGSGAGRPGRASRRCSRCSSPSST